MFTVAQWVWTAKRLEPEGIADADAELRWAIGLNEALDDRGTDLGHSLGQPRRAWPPCTGRSAIPERFTPLFSRMWNLADCGGDSYFEKANVIALSRNFECGHAVQIRASIIATVRLGRCSSFKAFFDQRSPTKRKKDANMTKTHYSKAMTFLPLLLLAPVVHAQANDVTTANPDANSGVSKVRIVRLSQVRGTVQIDRSNGRGFEPGIANLPIVEKNQLRTGLGIAEVEFEDNSSLRLAPNSLVEFPRLERNANGATVSSVHVISGTAYISLLKVESGKAPANQFAVIFGDRKLALDPATHVRLAIENKEAKLAVLDGAVHVDGANGLVSIPKKKTATFGMFNQDEPTVAKDTETTPYDEWDHTATSYHAGAAAMSAFNSPYAYGTSDMAYYGNFVNSGGCGSMWRPYFASAAWEPFANGSWAYYPGAGYSWVSPYPWAWTPYHSGSWAYCDNVGWGWMPGGGWNGINNVAALMPRGGTTGGIGIGKFPHQPVNPPDPHAPSMIAVNAKPLLGSEIASPTSFVFRKDSAGLGVPRATLGNLNKYSNESISHGTAKMPIFASVPQTNRANGGFTTSEALATSIHRGYGPSPSISSQESSSSSFNGSSRSIGTSSSRTSAGSMPAPSSGGSKK